MMLNEVDNTVKVSVIIPVYKTEKYLRKCIDSVLNQTFQDFEIILVSDGPEAATKICEEYVQKYPNFTLITNVGKKLGGARNAALDIAKGEFVFCLDSDDWIEPNMLQSCMDCFDDSIDVVVFNFNLPQETPDANGVYGDGWELPYFGERDLDDYTVIHVNVNAWNKVFRKSIIDKYHIRFPENMEYEDFPFYYLFFICARKAVFLKDKFYNYLQRKDSAMVATYNHDYSKIIDHIKGCVFLKNELDRINFFDEHKILFSRIYDLYIYYGLLHTVQADKEKFIEFAYENYKEMGIQPEGDEVLMLLENKRFQNIVWNCGQDIEIENMQTLPALKVQKKVSDKNKTPKVTVLMPLFNGKTSVEKAIRSIQAQTFKDWEFIIVNDFGSNDGCAEIVCQFIKKDSRIKMYQLQERFGLAESLNFGMREAQGEYIARIDADDTSHPKRFAKQVAFMDRHKKIGILGTWQHHYGNGKDWIHKAAVAPEVQKCRLLFWCDLCHSTLMLRRDVFIKNNLFYDPKAQAEDYELWTRAMEFMDIANLPEVLGEYEEGSGITNSKIQLLNTENGKIFVRTVKRLLNVDIPIEYSYLFNTWVHPNFTENEFSRMKEILIEIWKRNEKVCFFDSKTLLKTLAAEWYWAKNNANWMEIAYDGVKNLKTAFADEYKPTNKEIRRQSKRKRITVKAIIKKAIKCLLRPLANFSRRVVRALFKYCLQEISQNIERQTLEHQKLIEQSIEQWTWERYQRTESDINEKSRLIDNAMENHAHDLKESIRFQNNMMYSALYPKKKVFLIGVSEHNNIGDAAITLGAEAFFHRYFYDYEIIELSMHDFEQWYGRIAGMICADDLIFMQGGGNLGSRFLNEENSRRRIIQDFPNNKIIILPQTIFFEDSEDGKEQLAISKEIYNRHGNLKILTRGDSSLAMAKEYFSNANCMSCLDMALMLQKDFCYDREGILLCIRDLNDESGLTQDKYNSVLDIVSKTDANYKKTTNYHSDDIRKDVRWEVVTRELQKYASCKVIVTDRLHGFIFAVLTKTPCVVISAFNQKIPEFYEFFKDSNAVFFIDKDIGKLAAAIGEAKKVENPKYPVLEKGLFEKLYQFVME